MMRKAATEATRPPKEGSGRRYWVHTMPTGSKSPTAESAGKRPSKARFLEPYRFSDTHRAALIGALEAAGVGDRESRELFASAIEYDIANARKGNAREAKEPVSDVQPAVVQPSPQALLFAELARAATELSERICALDAAAQATIGATLQSADPFRRGYDQAYFNALSGQIQRVAMAAASQSTPEPSASEPTAPPLNANGRRFLRRVARVYLEVLESRPDPATPEGPFVTALRLVCEEAGVPLPRDTDALAQVLEGP